MKRTAFTVLVAATALVGLQGCMHDSGGYGRHGHGRHGGQGPAGADDTHAGPREGLELKRFDLDGDGKVTSQELDQALHAEFNKYDVDHDGVLSATETRAANAAIAALADGSSPVLDWNGDGHVDFKEYATQWLSLFERLDADHDGVVTQDEMTRSSGPRPGHEGGGRQGGRHRGGGEQGQGQ